MEEENEDKTPAGRAEESDVNSVTPPVTNIKVEELQESGNETKCDPVKEPDEDLQSENNNDTGGGSEIKSGSSASNEKALPERTLVFIGDTNSIEIGFKNILLDHDEQANVEQFSAKLYDLCGRHISVINMLGLQNIDQYPLNEGIHAFLLLLPNGKHNSHYSSGVQWLEKAFGKGSLAYLMTVVTHESDENCESALTELKSNSRFAEKRYHTCTRSMKDEKEIITLLDKIDVMVSENDPHCYSGPMCDDNKEQKEHLEHKSHEEERIDSSVVQQNQTGDELEERAAATEVKPDPANHAKQSDKNDDSTREEEDTENKSLIPSVTSEKGDELEERAATTEVKGDPANGAKHSDKNGDSTREEEDTANKSVIPSVPSDKEEADEGKDINSKSSCTMSERSTEERSAEKDTSQTSQTVSTAAKQRDELEEEERARKTNVKCDRVDKPADVDHCETNDNNKPVAAGDSEIKSVPSATEEKNSTSDMNLCGNKEKQSEKICEETNMKKQYQTQTETLLSRLHLQDKLQQKFSPTDFLQIGPPEKQDHEISEKDLAHTFLQRLMMLDYRARYIPVKQDSPEVSHPKPVPEIPYTGESALYALFGTTVQSDQSKQSHVHPMDVQMTVFHCSDSFSKQNMITKLSQCQYALPLLVPDPVTMDIECPLWTFRKIRKTWKITQTKDNSNTVTMKSMPICNAETPMVSFFRLGSLSQSKSQLMNTLINDRHNTFFHRNCPGSTKSRYMMDGVAEIAWYCPAGKHNDAFTDCIAFCNLHGDALLNEKQRDILTEKSSISVVLVPTLEKGDKSATIISALYKSAKPLIILIADNDSGAVQMNEGKYKMGLKDRSQSDVSEELKGIIRNILSGPRASFQLETMAEVSGIRVDEDDSLCQKGKSAAEGVVKLLQGMDGLKIKDTFLRCQGKLWSKWCRTNKELYRLTGNIETEKSEKEKELKQIRQDQCEASCSELMRLLIGNLSSLKSTDREYFLKWTQILMDALCTDDLSSILQSYDKKWSEVLALKKKHDKSNQLKMKQKELEEISTKLQSATFGLEHMFREMGQIYEAHKSLEKQPTSGQTDWSKYPELAAELMISGHPMELMDGDAGHVPLTWISSLLDEVIKKLGNKRVFVLSVLGIQSSGKSTMLNAMFGLQFAVSAGRCTKGAFMQLVRVSEEIKKDFQFDYVLVVDTEGLRALELEGNTTLHHDNELATFVVGLGNMTLINIFGENPADMQDVLQIVVQAFMRMKQVKLSPSCVFVHQNVADIAATEINMDGKRRLQEKLDQMAQLAAKEEGCDAECFSDVIAFDVQKDVRYFAQLWEGSPPMAPPNPGYSESVQELKTFILSKASQSGGITLKEFKSKIHDLWNALLNENFVFSFKNTLEIAVYRKLEVQYGDWTWTLRSKMLTIENQLYNRIENGKLDKVELSFLHKQMGKTYEEIKKAMKTYFDDDRDKEMLAQWRRRFENKMREFRDDQARGVKRKLDEVIQQKNACKELDEKKPKFESKLLEKSKDLAHRLKDKANDEAELRKQFNSFWSGCVSELTRGIEPIKDINYEEDHSEILQHLCFEWALIKKSRSSRSYKKISLVGNYSDYVVRYKTDQQLREHQHGMKKDIGIVNKVTAAASNTFTEIRNFFNSSFDQYEEQQRIRSLIEDVGEQSLNAIKSKPVATRGYSPAYLQEVANNVKKKVTEFESKRKYALKKEFTVDLVLYVFDRAESWLTESHKKFKESNDALFYLESKKEHYYNIFKSFCKGSSSAVVFGELICEKLKSSTVEAVCNNTAFHIADEMKHNFPAFSGNRSNLEKHVLKSLAEKEDFNGFITYIRKPREQVEAFIKDEVQKYVSSKQKDKAQNILKKIVEEIKTFVSQALFDATEKIKRKGGDVDTWMEEFYSLLIDKLTFDTICCQNFRDINNFDFLKEEIEKGLESIMEEMSSLSLDKMKEFRMKPDEILIDQLCDCCWVKCPFCAAVCTNTLADHSPDKHNVPFHRPSGIKGWHFKNTDQLVIDFCTTLVASDLSFYPLHDSEETFPYKEYPKAGGEYATWIITPDESKQIYWKWFVCQFQQQLEDHYELKFHGRGTFPSEWKTHSKEEAIKSLDEM
uniref:VLIG-type G domain-containing protein n=1 Tax=Sparus aurata TaxID=8175 RepID=A0A671V255_SPAAU